jgi:hypothetical protein
MTAMWAKMEKFFLDNDLVQKNTHCRIPRNNLKEETKKELRVFLKSCSLQILNLTHRKKIIESEDDNKINKMKTKRKKKSQE